MVIFYSRALAEVVLVYFVLTGNIRLKENKFFKSDVRSKPTEELHEFDDMDGYEDGVDDELDFDNGSYEIKRLESEPSKTKEEAEKTAIGLLTARLEFLADEL